MPKHAPRRQGLGVKDAAPRRMTKPLVPARTRIQTCLGERRRAHRSGPGETLAGQASAARGRSLHPSRRPSMTPPVIPTFGLAFPSTGQAPGPWHPARGAIGARAPGRGCRAARSRKGRPCSVGWYGTEALLVSEALCSEVARPRRARRCAVERRGSCRVACSGCSSAVGRNAGYPIAERRERSGKLF